MPLLERHTLKAPVLPMETVACPALEGDVIVRGLLLSERLELTALNAALAALRAGETDEQARARAGAQMVAHTLARCVVLADQQPLYSSEQWDQFGAQHPGEVLDLFKVARRLGGQDPEAAEKN